LSYRAISELFRATRFRYYYPRGADLLGKPMRAVKGVVPTVVSVGLILAVTAILWHINAITAGSHRLIYFYLFPVALIAALYNGPLAVLSTAIAIFCADYFLQEPIYSLANDNPLEYGDLIVFALLAVPAVKFIRVLVQPSPKILKAASRYRWD
jgi:K+-sensing histidine kinase KdpD